MLRELSTIFDKVNQLFHQISKSLSLFLDGNSIIIKFHQFYIFVITYETPKKNHLTLNIAIQNLIRTDNNTLSFIIIQTTIKYGNINYRQYCRSRYS